MTDTLAALSKLKFFEICGELFLLQEHDTGFWQIRDSCALVAKPDGIVSDIAITPKNWILI